MYQYKHPKCLLICLNIAHHPETPYLSLGLTHDDIEKITHRKLPVGGSHNIICQCHIKYSLRAIPTRRLGKDRHYNRPATGDYSADLPVGMTHLLGDWATDRRATAVAGRLGTADLYQACLIFHCPATSRRDCLSPSGYGPLYKGQQFVIIHDIVHIKWQFVQTVS